MEPLPVCIILFVLLLLCGLLTLMTAALDNTSLSLLQKEAEEDKRARKLLKLKENEAVFLSSCRFWTILLLLLSGVVSAEWISEVAPIYAVIIVLVTAFVAFVLSRMAPLRIALKHAEVLARGLQVPMWFIYILTRPVISAAGWLSRLIGIIGGVDPDEELSDITEEEIRLMVGIGSESGAIAPEEKEFIENIFEFDALSAADVMTHRTDVAVLKMEDDPREWEKVVRDSGFSRFPVCGSSIDNIVGVVHARELYEFLYDGSAGVSSIIRPAYVVPETVPADMLFRNMQQAKNHMAIVADEYGGFSGIVTIDDLLEELVGQIVDEKEEQLEDAPPVVKLDDNTWTVDGTAPLRDVSEALGVDLPTEEYDTIGGLIFAQMDKIPDDGLTFEVEAYGLQMKVVKISDRRIERVLICVTEPSEELENSEDSE